MQQLLITTSGDNLMKKFYKVACLLEVLLQVFSVPRPLHLSSIWVGQLIRTPTSCLMCSGLLSWVPSPRLRIALCAHSNCSSAWPSADTELPFAMQFLFSLLVNPGLYTSAHHFAPHWKILFQLLPVPQPHDRRLRKMGFLQLWFYVLSDRSIIPMVVHRPMLPSFLPTRFSGVSLWLCWLPLPVHFPRDVLESKTSIQHPNFDKTPWNYRLWLRKGSRIYKWCSSKWKRLSFSPWFDLNPPLLSTS